MITKILVILIIIAAVGVIACIITLKHEIDNAIELPEDFELFDDDEHTMLEVWMNENKDGNERINK